MKTACLSVFGLIASLQLVSAQTVLYQEDWGTVSMPPGASPVSAVGWSLSTEFGSGTGNETCWDPATGATLPNGCVYIWAGSDNGLLSTTNGAGSGTGGDSSFTSIDPTHYSNLVFSVEMGYWYSRPYQCSFAVQVGGAWYVSTTPMSNLGLSSQSYLANQLIYNPEATNWNDLTVGGSSVTIGGAVSTDLSGPITGFGLVLPGNEGVYLNEIQITSVSNSPGALPPTLVAAPLSQYNVYAGGGVSFSVDASPSQPYDYYWQKGGVNLTNDSRISGVNSATLTILGATAADEGNYSVIVSNSAGFFNTSTNSAGPAYLNVNPLPSDYLYAETFSFVGPSTGLNYSLGTVGWSCSVPDNTNRLIYSSINDNGAISAAESWQQGPWPIVDFFYASTNSDTGISGVAFKAIDTTANPVIAFSVDVDPTSNEYNSPGNSTAYFAVQMNGGSWYVSTIPIAVIISPTDVFATYQQQFHSSASLWDNLTFTSTGATIGNPAAADLTGQITGAGVVVVMSYESEWDFENFLITTDSLPVNPPSIATPPPVSQAVYTGGGASFEVLVSLSGTPPYYYYWQSNGVTIATHVSGKSSDVYTLADASITDACAYSCIVSNAAGSDNTANYGTTTLTVNPTPAGLLYAETFPTYEVPFGFYPIETVGWISPNTLGVYSGGGETSPAYFYSTGAGIDEFYATTASDTGVSGLPFPNIDLAGNTNLALAATVAVYDTNTTANFIVEINSNSTTNWFISKTNLPLVYTGPMNYSQAFAPGATLWNTFNINSMTVGGAAASNLTGSLIGAGVFFDFPNGENGNISFFSISLAVPPPIPVGLTATAGIAEVALSWTASFSATSYNVKRSTTTGEEETITNVTAASYTDTQVFDGTPYYYEVSAVNAFGESANSAEVSARPQDNLGGISVGSIVGNTLTLNWTAGANVDLQTTTNLTPPVVWTDVPNTTGQGSATISTTNSLMFFRLAQP